MDSEVIKAFFSLGLKVAEHVHGVRRDGDDPKTDAIFETLKSIASGDLSLLDTPEEMIAKLPTPPLGLKPKFGPEFYEMMRISQRE